MQSVEHFSTQARSTTSTQVLPITHVIGLVYTGRYCENEGVFLQSSVYKILPGPCTAVGGDRSRSGCEQGPADDDRCGHRCDREWDAEAHEHHRRVAAGFHHHQVRLMAKRVEEREGDARSDQRQHEYRI